MVFGGGPNRVGKGVEFDDCNCQASYGLEVDAVSDRETILVGGNMGHIEDAGMHSGDSDCALLPKLIDAICTATHILAAAMQEGRPNLLDSMTTRELAYIFNAPSGKGARTDEGKIRAAAVAHGVPCVTTLPGCHAVVQALQAIKECPIPRVKALQDWIADS
jgi:hypothetical protein